MPVTEEDVRNVLKQIFDPEIALSIIDLGLVYGVDITPTENGKSNVNVRMTLTTPACPYGPALISNVYADVNKMPEIDKVNVEVVWVPMWDPRTMASDEAKMKMGIFEID
ncbi:MAG: DUF59 domain-containing protein [Elusimicrobia bacterium]|nr:DUF59 domain-containing protein [Elusimicrobiota bacterium]